MTQSESMANYLDALQIRGYLVGGLALAGGVAIIVIGAVMGNPIVIECGCLVAGGGVGILLLTIAEKK